MSFNISKGIMEQCSKIVLHIPKRSLGVRTRNSIIRSVRNGVIIGNGVASRISEALIKEHSLAYIYANKRYIKWDGLTNEEDFVALDNMIAYLRLTAETPNIEDAWRYAHVEEYMKVLEQVVSERRTGFSSYLPCVNVANAVRNMNLKPVSNAKYADTLANQLEDYTDPDIVLNISTDNVWGSI